MTTVAVPRSRSRWLVLAGGTVAQGSFAAVFFGVPVLAPVLADEYELSLPQVGLMIAAIDLGGLVTLFAWGLLADRVGERVVIGVGLGAAAACVLAAAHADSYPALLAALVGAGAFGASVYTSTGRAVMGVFAADERGLALAIRHTANPLGGAAAALVLPLLAEPEDATVALSVLAAVVAAAAAVAVTLVRRPAPAVHRAARDRGHPGRDPRVWRLSIGSGLLFLAQASLLAFFVVFLHQAHDVGTRDAGLVLAVAQVTGAALRLAAGHRSDRTGQRLGPLLVIASGFAAALFATAAVATAAVVLLPLAVAAALSIGWNALSYTAAAELGGERAGAALGIQQTALSTGAVTAPVLFAVAVDAIGWSAAFALAGLVALAGIVTIRGLRPQLA
jgi:sugar phosphate permease